MYTYSVYFSRNERVCQTLNENAAQLVGQILLAQLHGPMVLASVLVMIITSVYQCCQVQARKCVPSMHPGARTQNLHNHMRSTGRSTGCTGTSVDLVISTQEIIRTHSGVDAAECVSVRVC